jgi:hypothetical protein
MSESRTRSIGPVGTAARILVGGVLAGSVVYGHLRSGIDPWAWAIGLVGFPAVTVPWQAWYARRSPTRLVARPARSATH